MARINLEDSLLKDDKFTELCIALGSRILALGTVLESFILAQKFYIDESNDRLIPLNEWQRRPALHILVERDFAEVKEKGIYVKGSKESFAWLIQKSDAGKKSAASKRIKRQMKSTDVQRNSTDEHGSQPPTLTPSLPHTPIHSSDSNSDSNLETTFSAKTKNPKLPPKKKASAAPDESDALNLKTNFFLRTYCALFKTQYGTSIDVLGKDVGIAKRLAKDLTEEKIQIYLEAYFKMPDSVLAKKKHPIADFEYKFGEITVFADKGNFTTQTESKQFDQMATVNSQLARIKSGAL